MSPDEFKDTLRSFALQYPGAAEGIACAATPIEKRTIKAQSKAFLFIGTADVMLKLGELMPEAAELAARRPDLCKAGGSLGWVTIYIRGDEHPPVELVEKWIDESYRLLAPKKLVASLPARS